MSVRKDLGMVTAYAYAVSKGYAGTEEEFATLMASYANVGQAAVDAALAAKASEDAAKASETAAEASETAAATSAGTATTAAQTASQAAQIATTKASEATTAASTATGKASEAAQSATEAAGSATTAGTAATNAQAAQTAAEAAQTAAEDAQGAAEDAAESVEGKAAQIDQNTEDISLLKSHLEDEISDIVTANLLINQQFNLSESIPSGSGSYKNVFIMSNIAVTAGDVIHVKSNVAASVQPGVFPSWLKIGIIQYDANNTVVVRNFDMAVPITVLATVTHIDFIISYSYANAGERYTEVFTGLVKAWVGNVVLNSDIVIPGLNAIADANLNDVSTVELGGLTGSDPYGREYDSTTRIRSGYIAVYGGTVVGITNSAYNYICYVYDKDKTYVTHNSTWQTKDFSTTVAQDGFIRIVMRKPTDAEISTSEIDAIASTALIRFVHIPEMLHDLKAEVENIEIPEAKELLKYNDTYYADGLIRRVYNPYKDKGSTVLSGQLHCHIRYLDNGVMKYYNNGDMATAMQNYRSSGYDFLTITDYGYIGEITAPTDQQLPSGLIWMFDSCEAPFSGSDDGEEKPPRHMCVYNTDTPLSYQNNWMSAQDFADLMKPTGKIITLAHPFYTGTYQKPSVVAQIEERVRFCEVYNGLCAWHQAQGDNWIITPTGKDTDYAWETMLDNGLVVWGTSVSDAHSTTGISDIKNGCVKVFCEAGASRFDILRNLCLGKFYAVSNIDVNLTDVSFADGVYSVSVTDANAVIQFVKEGGTVLSTTTGTTASYTMTGAEKYVRARITLSNGEKIWTQPVINIFKPDYDNYFDFSLAE